MRKILTLTLACVIGFMFMVGCTKQNTESKLIVLEESLAPEEYAVGFRKEDIAFKNEVEKALYEMQQDGTSATISTQWFGKDVTKKIEMPTQETTDTSFDYIKNNGKIIMGLDDSFPPMGFRDENGNLVGYDIDMAKEVAKRLGVELVLQPIDWKTKELELNGKKIDVIWNGFTVTPQRSQELTLSQPYMENTQVVVVKEDSDIKTIADLKGKKIAVQDGSSAQDALKKDEALYKQITTIDFKENMSAILDVKNGNADALAIDSVVANYYLAKQ